MAHILINTIDEFKDADPEEVASMIEGEVLIETVPADPGYTNSKDLSAEKITGLNTEDNEINEGLVRYDIIFYVRMQDGLSQIIVNIESQKEEPKKYHILNRGIYYVCRMISSQKDRDFHKMKYNDIKRVYSIWLCMNASETAMSYIHLSQKDIVGSMDWKGDLGLLNLIMIGLTNEIMPAEKEYRLHRLLGSLFSPELSADTKLDILEKEYKIPVNKELKEDIDNMGVFSQIATEWGREKGREEGRAEEVYSSVVDGDYSIKRGMEKLNITDEEVFRKNAADMGYIIPPLVPFEKR